MTRASLRWLGLCSVLGLLPTMVGASSLGLSVGGGSTQQTANSPVGDFQSVTLSGILDTSETTDFNFSITGTHNDRIPATPGTRFPNSADAIYNLGAGFDWNPSDHVFFALGGSFSPKSNSSYDSPITLPNGTTEDGKLGARSGSWGLNLLGGYETAGNSDFESSLLGTVAYTHLSTSQVIEAIQTPKGLDNIDKLRLACGASPSATCKRLRPLLRSQTAILDDLALAASYSATLYRRTTIMLGGTYFSYFGEDPTTVGLFSVAFVGRITPTKHGGASKAAGKAGKNQETFDFGGGIPLAPLTWDANLGVSQRLGALRVSFVGEYGRYFGDSGHTSSITAKVTWAIAERWKVIGTLGGSRDVDSSGTVTTGNTFSLGLRCNF